MLILGIGKILEGLKGIPEVKKEALESRVNSKC